jgi:hypothetical protein
MHKCKEQLSLVYDFEVLVNTHTHTYMHKYKEALSLVYDFEVLVHLLELFRIQVLVSQLIRMESES